MCDEIEDRRPPLGDVALLVLMGLFLGRAVLDALGPQGDCEDNDD